MQPARHVPVLLDRVVALLAPALDRPGAVLVDATLGLGGHAEAVLTACPQARLIGIDRDPEALARAGERLAPFARPHHLRARGVRRAPRGARGPRPRRRRRRALRPRRLLDAARRGERGFAYAQDAPLDMRMDSDRATTAADVLNTYSAADLARILREYGEEKFARRIADRIVARARAASRSRPSARLSSCCTTRSRRRPAGPGDTRPSGRSRRCGSRSTASSSAAPGAARPRSTRSASAAAWS